MPTRRKLDRIGMYLHGGIGEVVNTPDCGSGMRGFDPHIPPQNGKKSKGFKIEIGSYESIFLLLENCKEKLEISRELQRKMNNQGKFVVKN